MRPQALEKLRRGLSYQNGRLEIIPSFDYAAKPG